MLEAYQIESLKNRIKTRMKRSKESGVWYWTRDNGTRFMGVQCHSLIAGYKEYRTSPGPSCPLFRNCTFVDKLESRYRSFDHEGWYADTVQDCLFRGVVVSLSHGRFLAAYHDSNADCLVFDLSDGIFTDEYEAARRANYNAEKDAETSREEDTKYQAESQIEDLREQNKAIRKNLFALIGDCRTACSRVSDCPTLIQAMKKHIKSELSGLEANRKRIAKLTESPWLAVE